MSIVASEARLIELLGACRGLIPDEQLEDMLELAQALEPCIALENLATQLYEYDVRVSSEIAAELQALGNGMGLQAKYWERLRRAP
ncbi:MAG: MafI family immunity protein [Polyangiaceae bacterium]